MSTPKGNSSVFELNLNVTSSKGDAPTNSGSTDKSSTDDITPKPTAPAASCPQRSDSTLSSGDESSERGGKVTIGTSLDRWLHATIIEQDDPDISRVKALKMTRKARPSKRQMKKESHAVHRLSRFWDNLHVRDGRLFYLTATHDGNKYVPAYTSEFRASTDPAMSS